MKFADVLFPPKCPACRKLADTGTELCEKCLAAFERENEDQDVIVRKLSLDGDDRATICISSGKYMSSPTRVTEKLLFAMKERGDRAAVRFFARVLSHDIAKYLILHGDDIRSYVITFAPRSKANKVEYGFDQAERLARAVAKYSGARYAVCLVRRGGAEQKKLDRFARRDNAETIGIKKGAPVRGAKLIIIDDLVTSGATLSRSASLLYASGAKTVIAATALSKIGARQVSNPAN